MDSLFGLWEGMSDDSAWWYLSQVGGRVVPGCQACAIEGAQLDGTTHHCFLRYLLHLHLLRPLLLLVVVKLLAGLGQFALEASNDLLRGELVI